MRAKTFSSTRCSAKTAATSERPKARWVCGGGKSTSNPYDPQIGAAAGASAATAARAQQFSEDYYRNTIAPLLERTVASSEQQTAHLNELYDVNVGNLRQANERYTQYGIPAENRYYDMVDNYSTEDEYQRQAMTAKGDVAAAQQGQRGQMMRQYAALGIDPTSPAAVAAMRAGAVGDAAVEAGAMNRARNAARNLGMQLKSDAANFGRGGQSGILQFGAGAQGNATGAFGIAQGALGSAVQAGGAQQAGYQTALQGYGQNLGAYTSAGNTAMNAGAQQQSAMWSGLGAMAGMAAGGFSDLRMKENIERVGTTPGGAPVYRFDYKPEFKDRAGHGSFVGVMAQDLLHTQPAAVGFAPDGYMFVDYTKVI